jgi:hypothetical protein
MLAFLERVDGPADRGEGCPVLERHRRRLDHPATSAQHGAHGIVAEPLLHADRESLQLDVDCFVCRHATPQRRLGLLVRGRAHHKTGASRLRPASRSAPFAVGGTARKRPCPRFVMGSHSTRLLTLIDRERPPLCPCQHAVSAADTHGNFVVSPELLQNHQLAVEDADKSLVTGRHARPDIGPLALLVDHGTRGLAGGGFGWRGDVHRFTFGKQPSLSAVNMTVVAPSAQIKLLTRWEDASDRNL